MTFPQGKQIGELSMNGSPTNLCSDTSGNVWVAAALRRNTYRLYKFMHGGTQPIATIDVPKANAANGCAVDPVTGNLAVLNPSGASGYGTILIWDGARSGKPKNYPLLTHPTACAYDGRGNLLVSGWADSDGYYFSELRVGSRRFTSVTLGFHTFLAGGVRWDGKYFALAAQQRRHAVVYRVRISGSTGKIVGTVRSKDFPVTAWIWVKGDTLVSTQKSRDGQLVGVWNYPAGGSPVKSFSGFKSPFGLTVSPGSAE